MKRKIFWIGATGLILLAGIVAFFSFIYRGPEVLTVSALAQSKPIQGQAVWVKGTVASGSIRREGQVTRFAITDSLNNLNTLYRGTLPDRFSPGIEMEVLGTYLADGTFEVVKFGKPPAFCAVCHG